MHPDPDVHKTRDGVLEHLRDVVLEIEDAVEFMVLAEDAATWNDVAAMLRRVQIEVAAARDAIERRRAGTVVRFPYDDRRHEP